MKEYLMNNAKERFSNVREKCVGMSEELYALTEYVSAVVGDGPLAPEGLAICLVCVQDDIQKGKSGFNGYKGEFPKYLIDNKNQVLAQMGYFPQVVDAIADEEFAEAFRDTFKTFFGINPPKRVNAEVDSVYPENIKAAVDWWANAILAPKLDNGEELNPLLMMLVGSSRKSYTEADIKLFKDTLAEGIQKEMDSSGGRGCYIYVDYNPSGILAEAGDKIGVDSMTGYPWKTNMEISDTRVIVSAGYGAGYETIWSKK